MSKERPIRDFIGKHLSLGGREVKVTDFRIARIVWLWFGADREPFKLNWGRTWSVPDPPKTEIKAGRVECRETLGSTARPRRETLFA